MKRIYILLLGFFVFFIGFILVAKLMSSSHPGQKFSFQFGGPAPTPKDDAFSILLLGYAGGQHDGAYLTDTILLASLNKTKKTASLISIPRDLWIKQNINGKEKSEKINALYQLDRFAKNQSHNTLSDDTKRIRNAILNITGIPVDRVVLVDFAGFEKLIDSLGGLDVAVDRSFEDQEFPIAGKETDTCDKVGEELDQALELFKEKPLDAFPCRYKIATFSAGLTTMNGETALIYARSRHAEGEQGAFARALRQQHILEALQNKLLYPFNLPKIPSLFESMKSYITTDVTPLDVTNILALVPHKDDYKIITLSIDLDNVLKYDYSEDGQYILIPKTGARDWQSIRDFISKSIIPTPTPTTLPSPSPALTE